MGCQLITVQREEEPCILATTSGSSQPSDGVEDLFKKHVQALHLLQDVCNGLPLPHVSDPLCS